VDKELTDFIAKQKELLTSSYEQGKQYTNIIIFGGYAGIFAIWNFSKGNLLHYQVLAVGLCTLISLAIYIIFELYGCWIRSTQLCNNFKELNDAEKLNELPAEYGRTEVRSAQKYMFIWPYFFFSSAGFALIAAGILCYSFISGLVCIDALTK
jgi:hypothetical protein